MEQMYSYDTEDLQKIEAELKTIGEAFVSDLNKVVEELRKIDISGEPSKDITACADSITTAISKLDTPDKIGESIGKLALDLGMQEDNVNKIFHNWSEALGALSKNIVGGAGVIATKLVTPAEGVPADYNIVNFVDDVSRDTMAYTADIVDDVSKWAMSTTGTSILQGGLNILSKGIGTLANIGKVAVSGDSNILGFLSSFGRK